MLGSGARGPFEIFVSRIPWFLAGRELKEYFAQFGPVRRCSLPFVKETGFHKGHCWIGFASEEGLSNALKKESHILEGNEIEIRQLQSTFARGEADRRRELQESVYQHVKHFK
uniref:SRA stem-loop interacting RNA binding protein n=1 Tax=Pelusios castaneus TaxID=367368 RepID=A0A8C8RWP9_9SAUR